MKVTLILGNGFDIKIGINTRYTDYYKYFLSKYAGRFSLRRYYGNHSILVQMMKNTRHENWSDLEQLFGETISKYHSVDAVDKEKQFLEQSLNDYLALEQKRVVVRGDDYRKLKMQLDSILVRMLEIGEVIEGGSGFHSVEVLTFNYTDIVDRIFENASKVKEGVFDYCSVNHIHGQIDDTLIFGVDHWSQYDYRIQGDEELLDRIMVKPELNNALRRGSVDSIIDSIQKADVIVIYGSSIGYTDSTWWRIISEWLRNNENHKVHIFGHVGDSNPASGTAQLVLGEYVKRFREFSGYSGNNIRIHKCENWMFSFDESTVEVI